MQTTSVRALDAPACAFYADALRRLADAGVPCLIGGAFAFARYAGVDRATKDLDVFLRPGDCRRAIAVLAAAGYRTEMPFPHWLAKARSDEGHFMDLIFSSGNGVARVDDIWFEHAIDVEIFGLPLKLSPPEEMIWSKAFVQERERFDGADVMHLIGAIGPALDWDRLLLRFGPHWRVLFAHLVTFGFVYPDRRDRIPSRIMRELLQRLAEETPDPVSRVCNGTLLSREQYLEDVERFGYLDGREEPSGPMTREEIAIWTAAIDRDGDPSK